MRTTPELSSLQSPEKPVDLSEISPVIGRTVFEALATAAPEKPEFSDEAEDSYYRGLTRLADGQTVPDN